jgi:hypothetical protein
MKSERTNFEGDWNDICPHCGKKQLEHRTEFGPHNDVLYEHRMPCEPEKHMMRRATRQKVQTIRVLVFVGWILVPLVILVLGVTNALVGWIAFAFGLYKVAVESVKLFGNPDQWLPGHKAKREREARIRHYTYHCERNPEGFARLRAENFQKLIEEDNRISASFHEKKM